MTESGAGWHCECAAEAEVSAAFAWNYWTDVRNWSDPPARFELEGAFASGARGTTWMLDQKPLHWEVGEIEFGKSAKIQSRLEGAMWTVTMRFDPVAERRTRITQRIEVDGPKAGDYTEAQAMFSANQAAGLKKLAASMAEAAQSSLRARSRLEGTFE